MEGNIISKNLINSTKPSKILDEGLYEVIVAALVCV